MTQSMAGLITRKLQSQERHVLQDWVVLQVGGMCGKYERWQLDSKFMQLRSFFVLCLNSIWLSGILVCDWAHRTNKWTVFFWPWREQACVCAAYIIWADSDPASHFHIQDNFRSEQGFNQLLPSCFWWLCDLAVFWCPGTQEPAGKDPHPQPLKIYFHGLQWDLN